MLETLHPQPQDKILQLIAMFRDDPRAGKIDLGVGVYKDATGRTPVMRAVRAAGQAVWQAETTKTYVALAGDAAFHAAMAALVLGDAVPAARVAAAAAPGGTGALRIAFDLIHKTAPGATVWHNFDNVDQPLDENLKLLEWMVRKAPSRRYRVLRRELVPGGWFQQHVLEAELPGGRKMTLYACCVITLQDGLIRRIEEYVDPSQAAVLRESKTA